MWRSTPSVEQQWALGWAPALIRDKPARLHLVLTGRGAPPELVDAADLVTEMRLVKHPYQQGITAQRGIEF